MIGMADTGRVLFCELKEESGRRRPKGAAFPGHGNHGLRMKRKMRHLKKKVKQKEKTTYIKELTRNKREKDRVDEETNI